MQLFGREPVVLEDWSRQPDGRISGTLRGRAVWLNVELEARLEADPRPTASYVETVGGVVYELGRRASSDDPASDTGGVGAGAGDAGVLQGAAAAPAAGTGSVLLSLLAAGVVGFFGGAEFGSYEYVELQPAQPPPPPLAAQPAQQLPPGRTYPAAERVSLTVSEQAARQQIRLDSDQLRLDSLRAQAQRMEEPTFYEGRLEQLKQRVQADQDRVGNFDERVKADKQRLSSRIAEQELRLRVDRESLAELQRVAAERGGDAAAVQLGVFPPSSQ